MNLVKQHLLAVWRLIRGGMPAWKRWFRQISTGLGLGGGLGAIVALKTGAMDMAHALPVLATSFYFILHPEQAPPMSPDAAKQMAQSVADAMKGPQK